MTKAEAAIRLADSADRLGREWEQLERRIDDGDTEVKSSWLNAKSHFVNALEAYRNAPPAKAVKGFITSTGSTNRGEWIIEIDGKPFRVNGDARLRIEVIEDE